VDELGFMDDADRETGEIVLAGLVEARHLRRLPAQERRAALPAAFHDALQHALGALQVQLARRVVIEKEKRLGAAGDKIVDAHGDEIDADRLVLVEIESQLELGADAVGAGDEAPAAPLDLEREQSGEAADGGRALADMLDELVGEADVDSGFLVGEHGFPYFGCVRLPGLTTGSPFAHNGHSSGLNDCSSSSTRLAAGTPNLLESQPRLITESTPIVCAPCDRTASITSSVEPPVVNTSSTTTTFSIGAR